MTNQEIIKAFEKFLTLEVTLPHADTGPVKHGTNDCGDNNCWSESCAHGIGLSSKEYLERIQEVK